jgi:hypothetical protein
MAVPAVQPDPLYVMAMAELHRLLHGDQLVGIKIGPDNGHGDTGDGGYRQDYRKENHLCQGVCPQWKYLHINACMEVKAKHL